MEAVEGGHIGNLRSKSGRKHETLYIVSQLTNLTTMNITLYPKSSVDVSFWNKSSERKPN